MTTLHVFQNFSVNARKCGLYLISWLSSGAYVQLIFEKQVSSRSCRTLSMKPSPSNARKACVIVYNLIRRWVRVATALYFRKDYHRWLKGIPFETLSVLQSSLIFPSMVSQPLALGGSGCWRELHILIVSILDAFWMVRRREQDPLLSRSATIWVHTRSLTFFDTTLTKNLGRRAAHHEIRGWSGVGIERH